MALICILSATNSAYQSVRGILLMAGAELDRLGHEVKILDLEAPDTPARMEALMPRRDEMMALVMSGIGLEIYANEGKLLWDAAQIPVFNWNCDHPSYFMRRHRLDSPYVVHGYVFPDHAVFNRDHLHANGAAFGAHIGIPDPGFFGAQPAERRNGRIVFAKSDWNRPSWSPPGARRCHQNCSPSCSMRSPLRVARPARPFPRSSATWLPSISSISRPAAMSSTRS